MSGTYGQFRAICPGGSEASLAIEEAKAGHTKFTQWLPKRGGQGSKRRKACLEELARAPEQHLSCRKQRHNEKANAASRGAWPSPSGARVPCGEAICDPGLKEQYEGWRISNGGTDIDAAMQPAGASTSGPQQHPAVRLLSYASCLDPSMNDTSVRMQPSLHARSSGRWSSCGMSLRPHTLVRSKGVLAEVNTSLPFWLVMG